MEIVSTEYDKFTETTTKELLKHVIFRQHTYVGGEIIVSIKRFEKKDTTTHLIIIQYEGKEWAHLEFGHLIFHANGKNIKLEPVPSTFSHQVNSPARVQENVGYIIDIGELFFLCSCSKWEIKLIGKNMDIELIADEAGIVQFRKFYNLACDSSKFVESLSIPDPEACLPCNATITSYSGSVKVEEIKINTELVAYDERKKSITKTRVREIKHYGPSTMVYLKTKSQKNVIITPHHTLLTTTGWRIASDIIQGDYLVGMTSNMKFSNEQVDSIAIVGQNETAYSIIVNNPSNYVVDCIIASSFTKYRKLRTIINNFLHPNTK